MGTFRSLLLLLLISALGLVNPATARDAGASDNPDAVRAVTVSLPPVANAVIGQEDTIDITVSDVTGEDITAFQFTLIYDPDVLTVTGVFAGPVASGMIVVPNINTPGQVRVAAAGFAGISGSGVLVSLSVTYEGSKQTDLHFEEFIFNSGSPEALTTDGVVSVAGSSSLVAYAATATTDEDTPVEITRTGSDPQGDIMSFAIASGPSNGTLSESGSRVTYTPSANYFGSDSFTYTASDGSGTSSPVTVSITVNPVNDAPTASDLTETTSVNQAVDITLEATDPEGSSLTYAVSTQPTDGTVSISVDQATYTPDTGFVGDDTFTYTASDGELTSEAATVTVSVLATGSSPVAVADAYSVDEDATLTVSAATGVLANDSDADDDPLTAVLRTNVANGTLSLSADGSFTYTPTGNFNGSDSFRYRANDGARNSSTVTVTLTVNSVNDSPSATGASAETVEGNSVGITLTATDVDGQSLSFATVSGPSSGTVSYGTPAHSGTTTTVVATYTPAAEFSGTDSFTFSASDGAANSDAATVTVTVTPANRAPVASSVSTAGSEDSALSIPLTASDEDEDDLTFSIVTSPANGEVTLGDPVKGTGGAVTAEATYQPNPNFNGADSFTFKVNDGTVDSEPATVSISVTAQNDAPVADDASGESVEDSPVTVTLSASDVEEQALTFTIVSEPASGTAALADPVSAGDGVYTAALTYTPEPDFNGTDSVTYQVSDGDRTSNTATVSLTITPANDTPAATPISVETNEDESVAITLTGTDVDGQQVSFSITTSPTNGSPTISDPVFDGNQTTTMVVSYAPDAGYYGPDSFAYVVNDGVSVSEPATVSIDVMAVNDAPVASDAEATVDEDASVSIELSATDPDGDTVTFEVTTPPASGIVELGEPVPGLEGATIVTATYTPNEDFSGTDTFSFTANDSVEDSNAGEVSITVNPVNDAPVAVPGSAETDEDTSVAIALEASDVDGDDLTFSIVSDPEHGAITLAAGIAFYTPEAGYFGDDVFTFGVNDGTVDSEPASVSITVLPVNDAPTASDDAYELNEDEALSVDAAAGVLNNDVDPDGDPLTVTLSTDVSMGSLDLADDGSFSYTPDLDASGTDSFSYTISDGLETDGPAIVTLTVAAVNDPPVAVPGSAEVDEDDSVTIMLAGTDVDSPTLSFSVSTDAQHGLVTVSGDQATYVPNSNFNGMDSFEYVASDGESLSDPAAVSISVLPTGEGFIQLIHNAPDASLDPADLYLEGALYQANVAYQDATALEEVSDGTWALAVVPAGADPASAVVSTSITIEEGSTSAIFLVGTSGAGFQAQVVEYALSTGTPAGSLNVLFLNGSPDASQVELEFLDDSFAGPQPVSLTLGPIVYGSDLGDFSVLDASDVNVRVVSDGMPGDSYRLPLSLFEGSVMFVMASGLLGEPGGYGATLWGVTTQGAKVLPAVVTSTQGDALMPTMFQLRGNYPNPFNPRTSIQFDLPEAALVTVSVHDMLGRQVIAVAEQQMSAGTNRMIPIDAGALTSGIYVYRVTARTASAIHEAAGTMTLLK